MDCPCRVAAVSCMVFAGNTPLDCASEWLMTRCLWSRTETQPMNGSESGLRTALVYFFVLTTCGLAIWLTLSLGSGLRTDAGRGSVVSPVAVRLD